MSTRVGIVGVGEIAAAVVEGLCTPDPADAIPVFLSPRNATTAGNLARRFASVHVCADNQSVVDNASLVILAVRRDAVPHALAGLRIPRDRIVVSAVAGLSHDVLRRHVGDHVTVVRAIPLPAVRRRRGITVLYPAHPAVEALFDPLGGTLPVPDTATLDALQATTATISTHLHYLDTITRWAAGRGVHPAVADRYVRTMYLGVADAVAEQSRPLSELTGAHETPDGINQHLRTTWLDERATAALRHVLDDVRERLGWTR